MMADADTRKRIMIVDDHPLVRQGLAALIRMEPDLDISAEAGSAEETLQALAQDVPDLMLLDISLPGTNGLDLLKDLRSRHREMPVLVISMHEESVYAERVLRVGAHGYIMKHERGEKILEAIRSVLGGVPYFSQDLVDAMPKEPVSGKPETGSWTDLKELSNRELQVYTYIGEGLATRKIAERLRLNVKTIHVYREHIKRKLGFRNAPELVHHATHWVRSETEKKSAKTRNHA
jgi:DNA-binding NarL/FixJ family response regulator